MRQIFILVLFLANIAFMAEAGNNDSIEIVIESVEEIHMADSVAFIKNPCVSRNIYDHPYSKSLNMPDYRRLWINTGALFGGGVVALGVLYLLPDGTTAWNKGEIIHTPFWQRWGNNVKAGPVWDDDNWVFNYVLHPYGGAAYYMGARSVGCNLYRSFFYSLAVSTLFWEYGIEAFMEKPSIQDLITTPILGTLLGECFYKLKRGIVADGYELWGSRFLGNLVACLIDPVNEVVGLVAGNPCRGKHREKVSSELSLNFLNPVSPGTVELRLNLSF